MKQEIQRGFQRRSGKEMVVPERAASDPGMDMEEKMIKEEMLITRYERQNETVPVHISTLKKEENADLWRQLKRVAVPVVSGSKKEYENWKASFMACIDQAPATGEYKLLQLRQYLTGDALKAIEGIGHSAAAYETAKERLDRKFGGRRRQLAIYLEELENIKPIRNGNTKDLENFADVLDITIINLMEARRYDELGNGSMYIKLQKKIRQILLSQYHRWLYEKDKVESVQTLREWVIQEAEF